MRELDIPIVIPYVCLFNAQWERKHRHRLPIVTRCMNTSRWRSCPKKRPSNSRLFRSTICSRTSQCKEKDLGARPFRMVRYHHTLLGPSLSCAPKRKTQYAFMKSFSCVAQSVLFVSTRKTLTSWDII